MFRNSFTKKDTAKIHHQLKDQTMINDTHYVLLCQHTYKMLSIDVIYEYHATILF